jgi:FkbM family methyltransferase
LRDAIKSEVQKPNACCLYIGANDGLSGNLIYEFVVRRGLRAVMVEPVPYVFERLKNNYKNCPSVAVHNVAVGEHDGVAPFYYIRKGKHKPGYDQIGSFSRNKVVSQIEFYGDERFIVEQQIQCLTLISLLQKCPGLNFTILILDCEGFDGKVIKQIDFKRLNPNLIIFEHVLLPANEKLECLQILQKHDYSCTEFVGDIVAKKTSSVTGS